MSANTLPRMLIGGQRITMTTSREAFAEQMVSDWHAKPALPKLCMYANGQILSQAASNPDLQAILDRADYLDCDGTFMMFAAKIIGGASIARLTTTDFIHDACRAAAKHGLRFYFIGSTIENNDDAMAALRRLYPRLNIVGNHHGYWKNETEERAVVDAIKAAKPDVLWVGLGFPHQERFAIKYHSEFAGITWVKMVGGLYEFLAGRVSRAPQWIQKSGFEWLYRTLQEPKRLFWRYFTTSGHALWLLAIKTKKPAA